MTDPDPGRPGVTRRGFFGTAGGAGLIATGTAATLTGATLTGVTLASAGTASASPVSGGTVSGGTVARGPESGEPPAGAPPPGPREGLRILMAGNRRWVCGEPRHPRQSPWWRHHLAGHQDPFAVVVSCIDSRVPPELVFDCGLGEMFVVRTGAQALDQRVVLGSIEFGPEMFPSARLILVLGHSGCGAVSAAIKVISSGGRAPGHIQAVVDALRPAYHVAVRQPGDLMTNMIRAQTRLTVARLERDPLLSKLIARDGLVITGGHYELASGVVTIIS